MKLYAFLLSLFVLTGCAGYHIGPIQPTIMKGVTTIAVPTFVNKTLEPRIEVLTAGTVIKHIQQDGTYRVASEADSDVILNGTIDKIERRRARSVRGNTAATSEFILRVRIDYNVVERATGKVLFQQRINGETSFFIGNDLQTQERQAVALAVEEAAVKIVSQLSEGW